MPHIEKLADGVEGLFIKNDRFNTTLISFNFYLPLRDDTYEANALLPYVLSSCSGEYESFRALNLALGQLYGAGLSATNAKLMDYQWTNISVSVLNDRYSIGGEPIVSKACELLASLIFSPALEGESFRDEDVTRERSQMLDRIKGEINDKRGFARGKALGLMFGDDPFGIPRCGRYEIMEKVTGEDLFAAWNLLLRSAYVRINVIGEQLPDGLFPAIRAAFSAIKREDVTAFDGFKTPNYVTGVDLTERMDIAQGKLVMGFSLGEVKKESETAALAIMSDIFGGGPYSRLFTNVREKMSLCYYCACRCVKNKALMLVDSGVESANAEKAAKEILGQLEIMKNGEFTDEEFEASIRASIDSIKSADDSANTINTWYASRVFDDSLATPADLGRAIAAVTREDVINAARNAKLCVTYKLLPEEN